MAVHIVFGEMGSGKSFQGQRLATQLGVPYFEGDEFLSEELKARVSRANPLTVGDVNKFVKEGLIPGILHLTHANRDFVISQALYARVHREQVARALESVGLAAHFHWVRPVSLLLQIRALSKRNPGFKWVLVMLISKPWFQKPEGQVNIIANDYGVV